MGARRIRREQRQTDMAQSRHTNGIEKSKERARRRTRMMGLIKGKTFPFSPVIMSWLSMELDKPSRLITTEDLQRIQAS